MKFAIPIWNGRVSPVFDSAQRLLVLDACDGRIVGRSEASLAEETLPGRVDALRRLGIRALVCGAVSRPLADMIARTGIELVPFVSGEADEVAQAYLSKELPGPAFFMPGCCGARRRGRGRGFGGRMRGGRA